MEEVGIGDIAIIGEASGRSRAYDGIMSSVVLYINLFLSMPLSCVACGVCRRYGLADARLVGMGDGVKCDCDNTGVEEPTTLLEYGDGCDDRCVYGLLDDRSEVVSFNVVPRMGATPLAVAIEARRGSERT